MIFMNMKLKLKLVGLLIGVAILTGCETTGYVSTTTPVYYSDPFYGNSAWMYGYGYGYYMAPPPVYRTTVIVVPPRPVHPPVVIRPTPPPVPHRVVPVGPPMPPRHVSPPVHRVPVTPMSSGPKK